MLDTLHVVFRICGRSLYLFIPSQYESVIPSFRSTLSAMITVRSDRGYKQQQVEAYSLTVRDEGFEIITYTGFVGLLKSLCDSLQIPFKACEVVPREDKTESVYKIDNLMIMRPLKLPRLQDVISDFREWQVACTPIFTNTRIATFSVATGGGKSFLLSRWCYAASDCKILVTTPEIADLQVIYNDILSMGQDVTWVKGPLTQTQKQCRIICAATTSVHHCRGILFDICFGDEIQKTAGRSYRNALWQVYSRRTFGFSASVGKRADKQDIMVMGQFGPILLERTYEQNKSAGDIVPIYYRRITTTIDPKVSFKSRSPAIRYRILIVRNKYRNKEIADIARFYADKGKQVLIMTSTVEHTLRLCALLPDAIGCYRGVEDKVKNQLMREGLWHARFKLKYSNAEMNEAIDLFASGKQRIAVANKVWWKAKNFPQLEVLIRADAINTAEAAIQIAGRLARKCAKIGKTHGLLVDCKDEFDASAGANSKRRATIYKKMGWKSWEDLRGDQEQEMLF